MTQVGTRKLHWIMIALGVIAFVLVVTDRVQEAFKADDAPESQASAESSELPSGGDAAGELVSGSSVTLEDQSATDSSVAATDTDPETQAAATSAQTPLLGQSLAELALPEAESLVTLENLFGSPLVLVSATEPSYVMTEDQRRFEVGGVINENTTLAGVTGHQLIFEQSGDLLVISLPEPVVQ